MSLYDSIVRPILFRLPAETAHELALGSLSLTLTNKPVRNLVARRFQSEPFGKLDRFGLEFRNPIGLAAGFDKNGTAAQALSALGFGFIEVGTVTSEPQPGNQTASAFRIASPIVSSYGGRSTPRSVMMAVISAAGVTSKAG